MEGQTEPHFIDLAPSPSALVEALRGIGYSTETAAADIIDNSITAEAKHIWIRASWDHDNPWLAIADDGHGMSREKLTDSMKLGSMSPALERKAADLGRFGLGMKTASFSQCRQLTVLSRQNGDTACCEWDLDIIAEKGNSEWKLKIISNPDEDSLLSSLYSKYISDSQNGTIVLWRKIDRFDEQDTPQKRETAFNETVHRLRAHLGLVFHRFILPDPGKQKQDILINEDSIDAFNPFNPNHPATQELPLQNIILDGEKIAVQPYILPHHNKISREDYDKYAGEDGYLHNQGFYIYRNRRLIIKGTWFRLIKKEELNKLIRIRVDIPNTLDHLWNIDVKKSNAFPPERFRKELRQIIHRIQDTGQRIYRQRGQRLHSATKFPAWSRRAAENKIIYEINDKHPLLIRIFETADEKQRHLLRSLLATIESSLPMDRMYHDIATQPEQMQAPEVNLEQCLEMFLAGATKITPEFIEDLLVADPFASNREATETILRARGLYGKEQD